MLLLLHVHIHRLKAVAFQDADGQCSAVHYCTQRSQRKSWHFCSQSRFAHAWKQTCDTAYTELYAANELVAQLRALTELQLLVPLCTLRTKRQSSQ